MAHSLPSRAETVMFGDGSIGIKTADHLTRRGHTNVAVLEQGQLISGATWHATGPIAAGLLRSEAECADYTHGRDLYANLEQVTGLPTGFRAVGYVQIATNHEGLHELRRVAAFMQRFAIDCHEVSVTEAQDPFPIGDPSDVVGAFLIPEDGRAEPVDLAMSLARAARMGGAQIFEGTHGSQIIRRNRSLSRSLAGEAGGVPWVTLFVARNQ